MSEGPKMEKLTTNLSPIEIARIDILVEAGFYPNRSEFTRAAIRDRLDSHQDFISKRLEQMTESLGKGSKDQITYSGMGIYVLSNEDFERAIKQDTTIRIHVIGMLKLSEDVDPELIERIVDSVKVYGVVRGPQRAREALEHKMEVKATK